MVQIKTFWLAHTFMALYNLDYQVGAFSASRASDASPLHLSVLKGKKGSIN